MLRDLVPITCSTSAGGTETLWARDLGDGRLGLETVPFAVDGVAPGDILDVDARADGTLVLRSVREPGGWHVFAISPNSPSGLDALERAVAARGARVSQGGTIVAAAVAGADADAFAEALEDGRAGGLWRYVRTAPTP